MLSGVTLTCVRPYPIRTVWILLHEKRKKYKFYLNNFYLEQNKLVCLIDKRCQLSFSYNRNFRWALWQCTHHWQARASVCHVGGSHEETHYVRGRDETRGLKARRSHECPTRTRSSSWVFGYKSCFSWHCRWGKYYVDYSINQILFLSLSVQLYDLVLVLLIPATWMLCNQFFFQLNIVHVYGMKNFWCF